MRARARAAAAAALVATVLGVAGCGGGEPRGGDAREEAIAAAGNAYQNARAEGVDFTNGPCIADPVIPDWVVDIAHDPRQDVDDEPENQCASYRSGESKHFVELDPDGSLIRAE